MGFVVISPENQQLTFTDMPTGRGHLVLVSERFEIFAQLFHQLLLLNKPGAAFQVLGNPKIKLSDLSAAKSKKATVDAWMGQGLLTDRIFSGSVNYFVDGSAFFKFIEDSTEPVFVELGSKVSLGDLRVEATVLRNDSQFLFQVSGSDKRTFLARVIKRFTQKNDALIDFRAIFSHFQNRGSAFERVFFAGVHPAFFVVVSEYLPLGSLWELTNGPSAIEGWLGEGHLRNISRGVLEALASLGTGTGPTLLVKPENIFFCGPSELKIARVSFQRLLQATKMLGGRLRESPDYLPRGLVRFFQASQTPETASDQSAGNSDPKDSSEPVVMWQNLDFYSLGVLLWVQKI